MPDSNPALSPAYRRLANSAMAERMSAIADAAAVSLALHTDRDGINADIGELLAPSELFSAVDAIEALDFRVGEQDFSMANPWPMADGVVVGLMQAAYERIYQALLLSHSAAERALESVLPGASISSIVDVNMTELIDYDEPDSVPEWQWVKAHGSYTHRENGEAGIWEFIVNLSTATSDCPERLASVVQAAKEQGCSYILFHQGT